MMRRTLFVFALTALVSCGDLKQGLLGLRPVQQAVVQRLNDPNVTVDLRDRRLLTIRIGNSPLHNLPPDERRRKALEIAAAGYAAYAFRSSLEQVEVFLPDSHAFQSSQLVATTTAFSDWRPPKPPVGPLYFLSIGDKAQPLVEGLAASVGQRFSISVTILPGLPFDRATYDSDREQLIADELIGAVRQRYASILRQPTTRVIAITSYDMYLRTRNWKFAFSSRDQGDQIAVVSYARMDPAILGNVRDDRLLESRLRKMVTKNIGVMCYGLPLSADPRSVLFGNIGGTDELDVMTEDFAPLGHLE